MNNVYDIVYKKEKCMQCGACVAVCPTHIIQIKYNNKTGRYDILVGDDCCQCQKCLQVCPALRPAHDEGVIGGFHAAALTSSTLQLIRNDATSGGSVNSILRYLLDENIVDAAILTVNSYENETKTKTTIVYSSDILKELPRKYASRYVHNPTCETIGNLKHNCKYAFVGTPCQIWAAKKLLGTNGIYLGVACSQGISYKATSKFLQTINHKKIENILYRGEGWPGYITVEYKDGLYQEKHLTSNFNAIFSSQIYKNPGCRNCHDQFAETADISFFDYWNPQELSEETMGKSGTIIRTQTGEEIIRNALEKGYINVHSPLTEDDIVNSQLWVTLLKKKYYNHILIKVYYKIADIILLLGISSWMPVSFYRFMGKGFRKLIYMIHHYQR